VLTKGKITRMVTYAGFSRKFADMILGSYAPFFFMLKYPANKATFALLNAVSLATLGFCSNILNGVIGDKYADKIPGIKAYMCSATALISALVTACCFVAPGGFWMSFACYSMHILFSAGY
jgi:MFS family permease